MTTPKAGSKWAGHDRDVFIVLHTIELDGQIWVHYRKERDSKEYSCFLESFLQRFTSLPE